ncbi:hypothetical protein BDZ91DRAFT_795512 [Kalaharituber pfeilii]|nr:hypothetical protein BDZ91DRAFT_795512 [Kalaharituber pfeilii]
MLEKQTNRTVAIKSVMRAKLNRRLLENLESEIAILTSLKHPHITRLKECIKARAHIHLVMEYCSMGDLAGFIKNREKFATLPVTADFAHLYPNPPGGGLHEVIVRHFLKQLASALAFLRSKQLIHRDLKPQNLLLSPPNYSTTSEDGEEMVNRDKLVGITNLPVLKIADFGFARELQVSSLAETLCGSPLYMAPEILRYEKYDAKADLWSMGTVLYEMIAGRPPFRASNHVDLLRKIEEGNDRITFPSRCVASDELKDIICGLLKRSPVERMSFAQFFNHPAVQDDIPGAGTVEMVPEKELSSRRRSIVESEKRVSPERQSDKYQYAPDYREPEHHTEEVPPAHNSRPPADHHRVASTSLREHSSTHRPPIPTYSTTPGRQETTNHRQAATPMERRVSQNTPSAPPSPNTAQQQREAQLKARAEREAARAQQHREARERAEQDLMQEYVVIEKRSVEVNALADELAASPRVAPPASPNTANALLARRSSGRGPSRPSTADRSTPQPARSMKEKYGASPGSAATSALARALSMAPFRIFGVGTPQRYSPPQSSPFQGYPTPVYHPGSVVSVGQGRPAASLSEEDQAIVTTLESCASKGDVVYHFAAVKYSQLVPMAPNIPQGLSLLPAPDGESPAEDNGESDLTPEAVVTISEQALVLYVKCISLLNKAMQIAGRWWAKISQEPNGAYTRSHVAEKINGAVQWIRQRFNEAMEKADYVRLKLKEAQLRLPSSHPSHPSNHVFNRGNDSRGMAVEQDIFISPGVTAERLMFDRAIEMSRCAAVNELVGEDLEGCQMSYITALKLVEAVLEADDDDGNVDEDDRAYIENVVNNIKVRIEAVKAKMAMHSKRSSGIHSVPSSPVPAYSPLHTNTPPK